VAQSDGEQVRQRYEQLTKSAAVEEGIWEWTMRPARHGGAVFLGTVDRRKR
jgi:hypothetical protein